LELFIKPEAWSLLTIVNSYLGERGIKAYLVGGFVRDVLLKRDTADIDIAVDADALQVAAEMADVLGGRYIPLDDINKVGRVVLKNSLTQEKQKVIDLATLNGEIEQDLSRRDFTIDAIAIDLEQLNTNLADVEVIDPFNGLDDITCGIVRAVSETAFESDPVRLLRAVRLAAELDYAIEKDTEALIRRSAQLIESVAGERIREEIIRLLAVPGAGKYISFLDGLGLLTAIIPELAQTKGVEQPKEHWWDVLQHSMETVTTVDFLLRQGSWEYITEDVLKVVPWSGELERYFVAEVSSGSTRCTILKMAALLHDIAKPAKKMIDGNGKMRFIGHAEESAEVASAVLERLRFSKKEIKLLATMVKYHMRPTQLSQDGPPSDRAIYRYFRDTGDAGVDILFLSLADHLAARGPGLDNREWRRHAREVGYVLNRHFQKERKIIPPKLIDGNDLVDVFGICPGPEIGKILEAVREAQAAGELKTRQEALSYIRDSLLVKGCK